MNRCAVAKVACNPKTLATHRSERRSLPVWAAGREFTLANRHCALLLLDRRHRCCRNWRGGFLGCLLLWCSFLRRSFLRRSFLRGSGFLGRSLLGRSLFSRRLLSCRLLSRGLLRCWLFGRNFLGYCLLRRRLLSRNFLGYCLFRCRLLGGNFLHCCLFSGWLFCRSFLGRRLGGFLRCGFFCRWFCCCFLCGLWSLNSLVSIAGTAVAQSTMPTASDTKTPSSLQQRGRRMSDRRAQICASTTKRKSGEGGRESTDPPGWSASRKCRRVRCCHRLRNCSPCPAC